MELHAAFADPTSEGGRRDAVRDWQDEPVHFHADRERPPEQERRARRCAVRAHQHRRCADQSSALHTYPGSLTAPPCRETVTWLVFHDLAQLSNRQFEEFRTILGNNFRPLLQRRSRRVVRSSVNDVDRQH
jgi:carbonic anhydrase